MKMTDLVSGKMNSFDDTSIYYEIRGEDSETPIIFVYGLACLMNHWHHQINYFSKKFQVVTYDYRGHHASDKPKDPAQLTIEALARDLAHLVHHLDKKKAHFVGHTFGVPVVMKAFEMFPEVFASMTFINGFAKNPIKGMFGVDVVGPFFHFVKTQFANNPTMWNSLWRTSIDNPISMILSGWAGGFNLKLTHFKDIEIYARGVANLDLDVFIPFFEDMMNFDGMNILPKINVPTLIISGEKDMITPIKFQQEMHDLIPGSQLMIVPYGSHCTQLDFPEYVNLRLEKFFKETDL